MMVYLDAGCAIDTGSSGGFLSTVRRTRTITRSLHTASATVTRTRSVAVELASPRAIRLDPIVAKEEVGPTTSSTQDHDGGNDRAFWGSAGGFPRPGARGGCATTQWHCAWVSGVTRSVLEQADEVVLGLPWLWIS